MYIACCAHVVFICFVCFLVMRWYVCICVLANFKHSEFRSNSRVNKWLSLLLYLDIVCKFAVKQIPFANNVVFAFIIFAIEFHFGEEYNYLSCVNGVVWMGKYIPRASWSMGGDEAFPSTPGTHDRYIFLHILFHLILWCPKQ